MTTFRITPKGQFSLEASTRFLEGFAPAAFDGAQAPGHLHLAFSVEGSWEDTVGVCVRKTDKFVIGEIFGDAPRDAVRQPIARILSLDVDGSDFQAVGERDLVVGRLQHTYPGLRPVLFWSPYEATALAIIGHRIRTLQAARIKQRMSEGLGKEVDVQGQRLHGFYSTATRFDRQLSRLVRAQGRTVACGRSSGPGRPARRDATPGTASRRGPRGAQASSRHR